MTFLLLALPVLLVSGLIVAAFVVRRRRRTPAPARTLTYRIRVTGQDESLAAIKRIVAAARDAQAQIDAMPRPNVCLVVEREVESDAPAPH